MEPMLVQQALAAGLDPTTVTELGKLLQPPGLGRKPALRNHTPAPVAAEVEESASSDEEEEGGAEGSGSGAPLQRAVLSLTKIVKGMRKEQKGRKGMGLEALLDGAEGGGSQRDVGSSSRSKAAALRALQQALITNSCKQTGSAVVPRQDWGLPWSPRVGGWSIARRFRTMQPV